MQDRRNKLLAKVGITKAKYVSDYILDVYFADGSHKEISFDGMFKSKAFFKKFEIGTDGWALLWKSDTECEMLPALNLYDAPPKKYKSVAEKYANYKPRN